MHHVNAQVEKINFFLICNFKLHYCVLHMMLDLLKRDRFLVCS